MTVVPHIRTLLPDGSLPAESKAHIDTQVDARVADRLPALVEPVVDIAIEPHVDAVTAVRDDVQAAQAAAEAARDAAESARDDLDAAVYGVERHDFTVGNIDYLTGELSAAPSRGRTDFIPVHAGEALVLQGAPEPDKRLRIIYYDTQKQYVSGVNFLSQQTTDQTLEIVAPGFIRYVLFFADQRSLTPAELMALPDVAYLRRNKLHRDVVEYAAIFDDITIPLPLEASALDRTTGAIVSAQTATVHDDFTTAKRTGKYLRVQAGTDLRLTFTGARAYVLQYGAAFDYLGAKEAATGTPVRLSTQTRLVKVALEEVTDYSMVPSLTLAVTGGKPEWVLNDNRPNRTWDNINFIYRATPATAGPGEVHFNTGILKLPPNYDPLGQPVRLLIFVQGSGSYHTFNNASPQQVYEGSPIFDYLLREGYAILAVYPWTTKYDVPNSVNQGTPTAMAAYRQAYEWVIENYNIARDGVFVSGKSSGGFCGILLSQQNSIPVLAAGILAPVISPLKEPFGPNYPARLAYAQDFGFEGDHSVLAEQAGTPAVARTPELFQYMRDNAPKLVGYNPYWNGLIGEDLSTLIEAGIDQSELDYESNRGKQRVASVPVKIWSAEDDPILTYRQAATFVQSIRNAHGLAELRTMPNGTGGHASVDLSPDALKVPSITTRLGYAMTDIPLAIVELVQFFRRFTT